MYSIEELEKSILAHFWNTRYWRDRQGTAFCRNGTNEVTGLPESSNDLLPAWRAISGDQLALEITPVPGDLATSMIKYQTSDFGATDEWRELTLKPRHKWSQEEIETQGELTHRIKLAAHKLASQGFINLNPSDDTGTPQPYGLDGMTARFQLTPAGLEEAKKRIRGTPLDGHLRGFQDALTESEKRSVPEWMKSQWAHGGREGLKSV
mgnify:CR=1 FL=1